MVSLSEMLSTCPSGAWVTEAQAVELLGFGSQEELRAKFNEGLLPNCFVEHGGRVKAPQPYSSHAFLYVTAEGSIAKSPSISLGDWVKICQGNPSDSAIAELIQKYTDCDDTEEAFQKLQDTNTIATALSPGSVGSGDYRWGTNGGTKPSKTSDGGGEIITKADGTRVRRVKRASSAAAGATSLQGFLSNGDKKPSSLASRSVAGDGEIYVRADGKKVRRVKKASGASVASEDPSKKNLDGFLGKSGGGGVRKVGGSASVAGDQIAVNKESSLTGEVYVRADGKKVRRVKKSAAASSDENVEIITRPDGTKVRRIRKTKAGSSASVAPQSSDGLSNFLGQPSSSKKSGSATVAGDQPEGEIYIRPDGTKVRRIRKPSSSATVSGGSVAPDTEVEIYTRPDGTKVRRIKKKAAPRAQPEPAAASNPSTANDLAEKSKTLDGFLGKSGGARPKVGGSASVAGDRIAVSKDESLTGEVYVRADGKKVRRVKKSAASPGDNVEIITRPDGTKVRRIRKTKPADAGTGDGLSGFLDSQPKATPKGGSATVTGDMVASKQPEAPKESQDLSKEEQAKKNLDNFLNNMDSRPKKIGGSASVAGDMLALDKKASLTGEVYVRSDGKKVRRVKKSSTAQPGDQVEIITRPDGTKVRRIKRAKKPQEEEGSNLGNFLGSASASKPGGIGSASVSGDMLHSKDAQGEIYIRADGKKVRRVRKSSASSVASGSGGEQYEIYVRPDGKKVRRIRRQKPAVSTPTATSADAETTTQTPATVASSGEEQSAVEALAPAANERTNAETAEASKPNENITPSTGETSETKEEAAQKKSSLSPGDEEIAAAYRKMLKMGMPDGAVMQKMMTDGIAQHIQDSVIAREIPAAPGEATPEAPAREAAAIESTPAPSPVTAPTSHLSAEDEEVASHYRKMLKMGMPEGAVSQKMATDGVAEHIQDSVLGKEPAPPKPGAVSAGSALSAEEEEIANQYRKMLKMGMPDGAVAQKMAVDGVAQNIRDAVLLKEPAPATATALASSPAPAATGAVDASISTSQAVPAGMALVPKDAATMPDGMVLVPEDQAKRTVPAGMVAVPKDQVGGGSIPDGYVLVPKDQVKGDPGKDDLVLVKQDQVKEGVVLISHTDGSGLQKNATLNDQEKVAVDGANIVSFDDLPSQIEGLKKGTDGKQPRFLLQALPDDEELEQDFIRKNLLPMSPKPAPAPPKEEKKAAPSSSIAELLAQMSTMGGDFDAEKMGELLQKLESAEKRSKKLEKQLAAAGVAIAEDIDYETCLKKVAEIGKRMGEIGGSDVTHPDKEEQNKLREEYFKLEQEMEKYNNALLLTDEYQAEQNRVEKKWEEDNAPGNLEALKKLRRHMPVEVRNMSEAQLTTEPTPNGKYIPKAMAKKFKRTNVLQIIRRDPDDIVRMHPSTLENMRVTGLTLTERRAIYEHIRGCGPQWDAMKAEKMTERKWTWYNMMKNNFKENLASYQRHVDQYGPPGAHPYATRANPNEGCPLIGKQCPLKADKIMDYDGDYGFTDEAVYEVSDVKKADADDPGAKAMQEALELMKEKKANERSDALKKHYKGKLLQVSKANGSCEQMDEMMDKMEFGMMKWLDDIISMGDDKSKLTDDVKKKEVANFTDVLNDCKLMILDFCGRSGMQLSGKKSADSKPDPRSLVECSLAEETAEAFDVFAKFITNRLKQTGVVDSRMKATLDTLKGLLSELRERNKKCISDLGAERLPMSRKLKTQDEMEKEIKAKIEKAKAAAAEAAGGDDGGMGMGGGMPGPPRGGLMDAIKGGRGGGGRGGLLDSIKGGRGGGRGGLLDSIKGGRGRGGGGRGGLLDAIKGGRGGGGGGRGGLLDAIKSGRGRGGGGGGGGRGGLLDAIKAGRGRDGGRGGRELRKENKANDGIHSLKKPCIYLSYCDKDAKIASSICRALDLIDDTVVVAPSGTRTGNATASTADRVIALITPNYIESIACVVEFNEFLLIGRMSFLQPILISSTKLPRYMQLVQYHDARPGRIDKVFQVLSSIRFSIDPSTLILETIRTGRNPHNNSFVENGDLQTKVDHFDIFISYSSKRRAQASAVLEILNNLDPGIKCFMDINELHAGGHWQQKLYQSLDNSNVIFVILTPMFVESSFCFEEAAIAALRSRECNCGLVAVEVIPLTKSHRKRLPKEIIAATKRNETLFQACERACKYVWKYSRGRRSYISATIKSTHYRMDKTKRRSLEKAVRQFSSFALNSEKSAHPKICILGHQDDFKALTKLKMIVGSKFTNERLVELVMPGVNDIGTIDSATILLCVLSKPFLHSSFCMNGLNLGLLRQRSEGGFLVPVTLEELSPWAPSYVRLLPSIHFPYPMDDPDTCGIISNGVFSAANLAVQQNWKDFTTLADARKLKRSPSLRSVKVPTWTFKL